jgi:hypothetical protein
MKGIIVMKKIIALILALTVCLGMLVSCGDTGDNNTPADTTPVGTTAPTVEVPTLDPNLPADEGFGLGGETPSALEIFKYKELADGTVMITGTYTDKANALEKIVVPALINGKKVSTLGESALATLANVKTIIVSGYVTEIQAYAFRDCKKLSTLKLPEYVNVLGAGVFSGCKGFAAIDFLPNSIVEMGERVFENCVNAAKIVIPDSVKKIGGYTFVGCEGMTEVVLSKNLEVIPERMFMGCSMLGKGITNFSITVPASVKKIGAYAFADCNQVVSFNLPEGLEEIGANAFDSCKRVTTIVVPDSVKKIGKEAFAGTQLLTSLTLPSGADVKFGADIINPKASKRVVITVTNGSAAHTWCTENLGKTADGQKLLDKMIVK